MELIGLFMEALLLNLLDCIQQLAKLCQSTTMKVCDFGILYMTYWMVRTTLEHGNVTTILTPMKLVVGMM
jgi:hypothetical protein